ncbi:21871_t:CDS:2, partial [Gigaspora margarita]
IVKLGAYKTANDIIKFLEPMLEEFGKKKNILSITTDNNANIEAAITKFSTSLLVSKPIANIFCAAHTLQLSVNAGLELTNDLENSTKIDYYHDGANICKKLLLNKEFSTVRALVNLLYLFHKAAEILSGSTYATLSIMFPTIEELIYCLDNIFSKLDIISDIKDTILSDLSLDGQVHISIECMRPYLILGSRICHLVLLLKEEMIEEL